jgi:putative tryptophan/tyrosine transport system substrate-binding protein
MKVIGRQWSTIIFVLGASLAICDSTFAQHSEKLVRIGFLDSSRASGMAILVAVFRQELAKLGWFEGKNIAIEYRYAEGEPERLPDLALDLVRLRVDLIVVSGTPSALGAKKATNTIPIVMATAADPVGAGLIASLARSGNNITGLSALSTDLNTKRLEILSETVQKLARVALFQLPNASISQGLQVKDLKAAATALKLILEEIETQTNRKELETAFELAKKKQVNGFLTTSNRPFFAERNSFVELARKHRLPAIYPQSEYVDEGGLMSYGVDFADLYRRTAVYVDKILKGAKPGDLPVEQPTKFEFKINLKAAKQIDLTIPPHVLARADRVIR